jgi:hypothetical protein
MGDCTNQVRVARKLAVSSRQYGFEYFLKLKPLIPPSEWPHYREGLLAELKPRAESSIYLKVLRHEGLKPQVMEYCRSHPGSVFELHEDLLPDYRDELDALFVSQIEKMANSASSRNAYQELCARIRVYGTAIDQQKAFALRDTILDLNPKKPALRDELNKLRF